MNYLPENDKELVKSNYMKLSNETNTFRILSKIIAGYEWWEDVTLEDGAQGRKPSRVKDDGAVPVEFAEEVKFFWAFVVWNFDLKKIQILEVKPKSIRDRMRTYINNPKWGDPTEYNFVVTKTGVGKETRYETIAEPKEKFDKEIIEKYKSMNVNLEELFTGGDPFADSQSDEEINLDNIPF